MNDADAAFAIKVVGGPAVLLGAIWGVVRWVAGEAQRRATAALGHIDELRKEAQERDTALAVLRNDLEHAQAELEKHRQALHHLRTELGERIVRLEYPAERARGTAGS